jgi:hypothetical protein
MLTDLVVIGGLMGVFVGLLELSHRLDATAPGPMTTEAAVREAMRGPEGGVVRAEFQRSGIEAPSPRRRSTGFGV